MTLIAENAGREGSVVVDAVRKAKDADIGYDAVTDEYVNMFKQGIVDPVKVVRSALENAASIARDGAYHRVAGHRHTRSHRPQRRCRTARVLEEITTDHAGPPGCTGRPFLFRLREESEELGG